MRSLKERDAAAVTALAAEIAFLEDAVPFPPGLLEQMRRLVGASTATFNELDRERRRTLFQSWSDADGPAGAEVPSDEGPEGGLYWQYRHEHPLCRYRESTNDWTRALIVSDFATQREFRRTTLWQSAYRDAGVNYWLDVGLRSDGRLTRTFVFTHDSRDFGERERLVLDLLQPHLERRSARTAAAAAAADALATIDGDDPHHIVLSAAQGVIEFASAESRHLLAEYLGPLEGRLPPWLSLRLQSAGAVALDRGDRRLTIRSAELGGLTILLLGEADLRVDRLTPRQRTILEHIAGGATNREAGDRLGIAADTVRKHLEQIYERLGVRSRTEAAVLLPTERRRASGLPSTPQ
jgi:DNA-binding CsgD family transcriptional regulator